MIATLLVLRAVSRHDIKASKTFSFVSLVLDVDTRLTFSIDSKTWSFPLVCPLEINVATPPRRTLDDVRCYIRVGCVEPDLVFAHYRGPGDIR